MSLTFAYSLLFPHSSRKEVIEALRLLCSRDTEAALTVLYNPSPVEVVVTFRSMSDIDIELPTKASGVNRFDGVNIRVCRSRWTETSKAHEFQIWPSSPKLQDAFFGSQLLRRALGSILEQCKGYAGYLVINEVDPIGFWHRSNQHFTEDSILTYFPVPKRGSIENSQDEH